MNILDNLLLIIDKRNLPLYNLIIQHNCLFLHYVRPKLVLFWSWLTFMEVSMEKTKYVFTLFFVININRNEFRYQVYYYSDKEELSYSDLKEAEREAIENVRSYGVKIRDDYPVQLVNKSRFLNDIDE